MILNAAVAAVGSGLGASVVTAVFQHKFAVQLETHKAFLARNSRVYERQVDALQSIYSNLEIALSYLQRAAGAGRLGGEASDEILLERMARQLGEASQEFLRSRLLFTKELQQKLRQFFDGMFDASLSLNLSLDPRTPNGEPRAALRTQAAQNAYKELPQILEAVAEEARVVIHG